MLRVITTNPSGGGHDITPLIDDLRWSSTNPGGDETANFTFKQPWSRDNIEIARGSVVRIEDGLENLWTGRIEEHDRGGEQTEEVAVTAYGLGVRLKDNTMAEIYVDRDLGGWGEMSLTRKIAFQADFEGVSGGQVMPDATTGLPGLHLVINPVSAGRYAAAEPWYDAKESGVAVVYYNMVSVSAADDTGYWRAADGDNATGQVQGPDLLTGVNSSSVGVYAPPSTKRFLYFTFFRTGAFTTEKIVTLRKLAVYGSHGVSGRGPNPAGFYDSDIVADVIGRVDGITIRTLDQGSYIIPQAAFKEAVEHEAVINEVSRFEQRSWGTFGSDNILDTDTDGRFDYKLADPSKRTWSVRRADCADLDLHSEMSTLFDTVIVKYQDESGKTLSTTRTRTSEDLIAAGASPKTAVLSAGTLTLAAAQTYGDVALALSGAFAPARGSVRIDGPVNHADRGDLPAYFMKADGSNLQIPDILPSTTMLALDDTPDRRTTFPIKRVSCDASGDVISTSVELDQTNDALSQLQNRLAATAQSILG